MLRCGGLLFSGQSALQQRLSSDGSAKPCRGFSLLESRHAVAAFKCMANRSDGGAAKAQGKGAGKRSTAEQPQAELLLPAGLLLPTSGRGRAAAGAAVSLTRGYLFVRRPAEDNQRGAQQSWAVDWTPPRKQHGARGGGAGAKADDGGC